MFMEFGLGYVEFQNLWNMVQDRYVELVYVFFFYSIIVEDQKEYIMCVNYILVLE